MVEQSVLITLWERKDWVDHEMGADVAKGVVLDMIRQLSDDSLGWLVEGLKSHQLSELAALVKGEMLSRGRAQSPTLVNDRLKLYGA